MYAVPFKRIRKIEVKKLEKDLKRIVSKQTLITIKI